jgi:hypothetical protein
MKRLIKILLSANLLAATALAFTYPHLMIAPGKLIPGHNELESDCFACHTPLHEKVSAQCSQCHRQQQWQPAIFDHDAYFSLDRDHDVRCVTCHVRNDYSRYTCYGCHEHTTQNIRREHIEEGIRDYQNCVECHRNADEHDIRGHYGRREDRHGDEKHHDD